MSLSDVEAPTEPIRSIWLIPTPQESPNRPGTYRAYKNLSAARVQARRIGAQVLRIDLWLGFEPTIEWEDVD